MLFARGGGGKSNINRQTHLYLDKKFTLAKVESLLCLDLSLYHKGARGKKRRQLNEHSNIRPILIDFAVLHFPLVSSHSFMRI